MTYNYPNIQYIQETGNVLMKKLKLTFHFYNNNLPISSSHYSTWDSRILSLIQLSEVIDILLKKKKRCNGLFLFNLIVIWYNFICW